MKKKLIIAAAIAFAVFAVPFGSSAPSTVSVASENNTVAPTPAPVVDVDKVKVSIDNISITDVSSADEAVAILKNNIESNFEGPRCGRVMILERNCMAVWNRNMQMQKESRFLNLTLQTILIKNIPDEWWVSSEGVALNDCAELQVDAPIKPSVSGVSHLYVIWTSA